MRAAGLTRVDCTGIEVPTVFRDFEDYWHPFTLGAGPAPGYCISLDAEARQRLKDKLRNSLSRQADGSIALKARAWSLRQSSLDPSYGLRRWQGPDVTRNRHHGQQYLRPKMPKARRFDLTQSLTADDVACGSLDDLFAGSRRWSRADRLSLADAIAERLKAVHGFQLLAVALYGSMARAADGPFSDIEMWVALAEAHNGETVDKDYQWVHGPGITEINLMSLPALGEYAARVEADWPVTHGQFVYARAVWED